MIDSVFLIAFSILFIPAINAKLLSSFVIKKKLELDIKNEAKRLRVITLQKAFFKKLNNISARKYGENLLDH